MEKVGPGLTGEPTFSMINSVGAWVVSHFKRVLLIM
ncbi:hypothetical protein HD601_004700 [Jiangella mangrovi]|uniref:Uncharacterized protein n=1 Tax=Jiangella mangrovi TaxID=1524084 RepID=A0A7W9GU53_9ACTN|nr:hypothetical protein [Jiangella mangrovi]